MTPGKRVVAELPCGCGALKHRRVVASVRALRVQHSNILVSPRSRGCTAVTRTIQEVCGSCCVAAPLTIKVNGAASTNGSGKRGSDRERKAFGRCDRVAGPAFVPHVDSLARPLTLALMIRTPLRNLQRHRTRSLGTQRQLPRSRVSRTSKGGHAQLDSRASGAWAPRTALAPAHSTREGPRAR